MKKIVLTFSILSLLNLLVFAQDIPQLKGYVNDYAGVLSSSEESKISRVLSDLERSTSAQVALLTVKNLQGFSLEGFALKTAEEWGLGQKDRDNGLLVLMALEEKKVRL